MDLGFGGLIEKFEEHFGKWWTRVLLGAVYLLIIVWLLQTAVSAVLSVESMINDENGAMAVLGHAIRIVMALIVWGLCALYFRWKARQAQTVLDRVSDLMTDVEEQQAEVAKMIGQAAQSLGRELIKETPAGVVDEQLSEIDERGAGSWPVKMPFLKALKAAETVEEQLAVVARPHPLSQ